ncbi:hypothetical protein ACIQ6K_32510 [Streptomyces sp. NPDC096354]|uniref:hypothetical protein n=1 Tax=Streptomyces sp. NPDC096354 TaxID=3366088 RepID=UPI003802F89F
MTVHIAPPMAAVLFVGILVAAYVHKRTQGDLIGSITAGTAVFTVPCRVIGANSSGNDDPGPQGRSESVQQSSSH